MLRRMACISLHELPDAPARGRATWARPPVAGSASGTSAQSLVARCWPDRTRPRTEPDVPRWRDDPDQAVQETREGSSRRSLWWWQERRRRLAHGFSRLGERAPAAPRTKKRPFCGVGFGPAAGVSQQRCVAQMGSPHRKSATRSQSVEIYTSRGTKVISEWPRTQRRRYLATPSLRETLLALGSIATSAA